jgi:hypothetical protein
METPKTFKELFANTGIEPTTDESGNTHYNFKAVMKDTLGKEFYESADKAITISRPETLEEASEYFAHNNFNMHDTNNYKALKAGFEEGAKWQQERSYSEEDMINFIEFVSQYYSNDSMENSSIEELLEQFKTK